jgi:hypothetical protein
MSTVTTTQTSQFPAWYNQLAQNVVGMGLSAAQQPFQTYDAPRIAPFTQDQLAAQEMVRQNIGSYQPFIDASASLAQQAASISGLGSAEQYLNKAGGSALTAAQPYMNRAGSLSAASAGQPFLARAGGSSVTAAQPYFDAAARGSSLQAASPLMRRAEESSSTEAAQPFLQTASRMFPQFAQEYMNPYIQQVVDRAGTLAARNLQENILPGLNRTFVGGGTFGGSRSADFMARAARDANDSALAAQGQLLFQGYGQAADIFGQDMARQLQAGQLAGTLSSQDASRLADLARLTGTLTSEDLSRQINIGERVGALTSQDLSRLIDAARAAGSLTQADAETQARLAQVAGTISGSDLDRQASLGRIAAEIADADARRQLSAAGQIAGLGTTLQAAQLRDVEALSGSGREQQALMQTSADLAYRDFMEERDYPMRQAAQLAALAQGLQLPRVTTTEAPAGNRTEQTLGLVGAGLGFLGDAGVFNNLFGGGGLGSIGPYGLDGIY